MVPWGVRRDRGTEPAFRGVAAEIDWMTGGHGDRRICQRGIDVVRGPVRMTEREKEREREMEREKEMEMERERGSFPG